MANPFCPKCSHGFDFPELEPTGKTYGKPQWNCLPCGREFYENLKEVPPEKKPDKPKIGGSGWFGHKVNRFNRRPLGNSGGKK